MIIKVRTSLMGASSIKISNLADVDTKCHIRIKMQTIAHVIK